MLEEGLPPRGYFGDLLGRAYIAAVRRGEVVRGLPRLSGAGARRGRLEAARIRRRRLDPYFAMMDQDPVGFRAVMLGLARQVDALPGSTHTGSRGQG